MSSTAAIASALLVTALSFAIDQTELVTRETTTPTATAPTPSSTLTVVCLPVKCDEITDNGASIGPGNIVQRPVESGRHVLGLHMPDGRTLTLPVEVVPESNKEVRADFGHAE